MADEFKIRSQLDGQPSVSNWKPSALSLSTPKYFLMFRLDDVMKTQQLPHDSSAGLLKSFHPPLVIRRSFRGAAINTFQEAEPTNLPTQSVHMRFHRAGPD